MSATKYSRGKLVWTVAREEEAEVAAAEARNIAAQRCCTALLPVGGPKAPNKWAAKGGGALRVAGRLNPWLKPHKPQVYRKSGLF